MMSITILICVGLLATVTATNSTQRRLTAEDEIRCKLLESLFTKYAVKDTVNNLKYVDFKPNLHYPTKEEIVDILYQGPSNNPYIGIEGMELRKELQYPSAAYQSRAGYEKEILKRHGEHPKLIVEVGSFVGSGIIGSWAPIVQKGGGYVVSVDTWLGDVNMRMAPAFMEYVELKHGMPTLYKKFISRMKHHNLQETVFPFPMPSIVAARAMAYFNWIIDIIYVDSAHELGETIVELTLYYQLLRPGGLLMGDDWEGFPAVRHDVQMFADCKGLELVHLPLLGGQWLIQKPK